MVKKLMIALLSTLLVGGTLAAQVGVQIPANTPLNEQAQQAITKKLQQLATLNSVGSTDSKACFVLVPQVDVLQSEITPTAPPQQLVKLSVVLMVTETTNAKNILAQTEVAAKGVGRNEAAAMLNAVQQIDVRSATLKRFMELAKTKMASIPPCEKGAEPASPEAAAAAGDEEAAPQVRRIEVEQCHSDIDFTVLSCTKVGKTFRLTYTLLNRGGKDISSFSFGYNHGEAVDNEGNKYPIDVLDMSGRHYTELISGTKVKGEIQIKNIDANATEFVHIKLNVSASGVNLMSNQITLRNVPIVLK